MDENPHDPQTPEGIAARISDIKAKIKARTDGQGKAKPGFAVNVEACKAEIARLESLDGAAARS